MKKFYLVKIERSYKDRNGAWHDELVHEGKCTKKGPYISVSNLNDKEEVEKKAFKSVAAALNYMRARGYIKSFKSSVEEVAYSLVEVVL